ncbi:putative multicopper oxidase [Hypoxylon sp. FL1284]|nr:putative multicopper oxidase [Hypoxylon sp. FL1284]
MSVQTAATSTDQLVTAPDTGITRTYDLTVTKETAAPDGVEVELLLVNSQFPGPLIECNWGDSLEITVRNNISDEGTSIHWHGLLQKGTPWMDGAPGITQCPIAPGSCYTYRYKPELYGTGWYHSHYEAQLASGLAGPMVIHGPRHVDYDIDLGPVVVSEYFHEYYDVILEGFLENKVEVTLSDNNLINGKNSYKGNGAPLASFNFTSGNTHLLRLINVSAFAVQKISIDGYTMQVIANDYTPIVPYETEVVTLAVGQRSDVLVTATSNSTDSVWLRAYKPPDCSPGKSGSYLATAAIFHEGADRTQAPSSQAVPGAYNDYCGNDALSLTVPLGPQAADEPGLTEVVPIELRPNGSSNIWFMANRTYRVDYNAPQLRAAARGDTGFPWIQNVHDYGAYASVRLILENPGVQSHPMHLHGHDFMVLREGPCDNDTMFPLGQTEFAHVLSAAEASARFGGGPEPDLSSRQYRGRIDELPPGPRHGWGPGARSVPEVIGDYGTCWDGTIVNPENPQRRDVQMLLPGHYVVIQFKLDNPGIWPLHCHIAWHLSGGMGHMILERPEDIVAYTEIGEAMAQTCDDWQAWSSTHVVDQVGGGL